MCNLYLLPVVDPEPPKPRQKGMKTPKRKDLYTPARDNLRNPNDRDKFVVQTENFKIINGIKQAVAEKVKEYLEELTIPPLEETNKFPLKMDTAVDDVLKFLQDKLPAKKQEILKTATNMQLLFPTSAAAKEANTYLRFG